MPNWNYTLELKDLLTHEDRDQEQLNQLNQEVSNRIESFIENNRGLDETLCFDLEDLGKEFLCCQSITEFNSVLDCVYDVCDEHRIWVK